MNKRIIWLLMGALMFMTILAMAFGTGTLSAAGSPEGSGSITTIFAGGNGQAGNMFDFTVIGASPVTITSFDINVDNTNVHTAEVYYVTGGGSYMGNEQNPAAWTMLGSSQVTGTGSGNPTPLPVGGLTVNPGETYGLYVTMSTCTCIDYTNGPMPPFSNADVQLDLGTGNAYPFGQVFTPRIWNGTVYYDIGGAGNSIEISKSPDFQDVLVNGTANFTITVTNTSTVAVDEVTVTDALAPDCDASLGTLANGASTSYTCSLANVTTNFTNVAVVTSTVNNEPGPTAQDTADVIVFDASLAVVKSPGFQSITAGADANFTITVTNTGSLSVFNMGVTDALVPDCDMAIGTLASGASTSYNCSDIGVAASYTNTVVVTGQIDANTGPVMASDDAFVEVNQPTDVSLVDFGQNSAAFSPLWFALLLGLILGLGIVLRRRLYN